MTKRITILLSLALASVTAACGGGNGGGAEGDTELSGQIRIDGSSTVTPLISIAAEDFQTENNGVRVTVGTSGTGGGFEKFCAGETDFSMASRPIKDEEKTSCEGNDVDPLELVVANDGLSVVVNLENDWADCLTIDQLKAIWAPGSQVKNWKQVDPSFPDVPLTLFGAGSDSGTFDYFTDAVNGEEGATRTDYNPSEDDNVTVTGVSGDEGAMGYFGLSYLLENEGKVRGVEIDGGEGCVAPTAETVQDGTYKPLSRPLFIYAKASSAARPEVAAFMEFYLEHQEELTQEALFVPMTEEQSQKAEADLAKITKA